MKNLVYFASGRYKEAYEDLPVDKVYLVDPVLRYRRNRRESEKIVQLPFDALESLDYFRRHQIFIDYFVCINEGLFGGGGHYQINDDTFLGYAMPVLSDTFYHLWSPTYSARNRMRIPYTSTLINREEEGYIDPYIFSDTLNSLVLKMTKNSKSTLLHNGETVFKINKDSIWSDYSNLDGLFIKTGYNREFFYSKEKVYRMETNTTFEDILKICETHKFEKIGITPWTGGNYRDLKTNLASIKTSVKEVTFYHLKPFDFQDLYN
jgi:hypothetical protein